MTDYSIWEPELVLSLMLSPLYEVKDNSATKALVRMINADYPHFEYEAYRSIQDNYYRFAYNLFKREQDEQKTN